MNRPVRFLLALLSLRRRRTWGPFTETYERSGFDHAFEISWSQGGEDLALLHLIEVGQSAGTYVDVGAHHPSRFSVTRHLSQRGWTGVNIDANPLLVAEFGIARPQDINICAAIGFQESYSFTIFSEPAISTISKEWEERFISAGETIDSVIQVPGITLRKVFDEYLVGRRVDVLNIDIEGADFEALRSLDLETYSNAMWPIWLILETEPPLKKALGQDAVRYATNLGYVLHCVLPMATILKAPDCK